MQNECQNIFIVEVVSLILLDKLTFKHNRQLKYSSVNCRNNSKIKFVNQSHHEIKSEKQSCSNVRSTITNKKCLQDGITKY